MSGRRYRLIEILGTGGFGTVYRAELLAPGGFAKQVALKVLHDHAGMPAETAVRLRDEARILGFIRHRAVVGVDALAELEDGWAVVMEYVEGADLSAVIQSGGLPLRAALEILEEVASALAAAYATCPDGTGAPLALVHRDIKPANIRVTPTGSVKVLDFGVARAEFASREAHTSEFSYGSLRYMAPERLRGLDGPEADVYALGLVVLALLGETSAVDPTVGPTGHAVFLEAARERVLRTMVAQGVQFGVARDTWQLLADMLAFDATLRPTASNAARLARHLGTGLPAPALRDWAEAHVPRLLAERAPQPIQQGATTMLVERTGSVALHAVEVDTGRLVHARAPRSRAPRSRRGWLLLLPIGSMMLVAGAMLVVVLARAYLSAAPEPLAGERSEPVPIVEPALPPPVTDIAAPKVAATTPDPVPVSPEPAATPIAVPSPRPKRVPAVPTPVPETTSNLAEVSVSGDARLVRLRSGSEEYGPGMVPPGIYTIRASWGDGPSTQAGTASFLPGGRYVIECSAMFQQCLRRDR